MRLKVMFSSCLFDDLALLMSASSEIRDFVYHKDDEHLCRFWGEHVRKDYVLSKSKQLEWQFSRSIGGDGKSGISLFWDEGSIKATLGFVYQPLNILGGRFDSCYYSHWFADEAYRSSAAGASVYFSVRSRYKNRFCLGLSNQAKQIFARAGYFLVDSIPRAVAIIDSKRVSYYQGLEAEEVCGIAFNSEVKGWSVPWDVERLANLWRIYSRSISICVDRDATYWRWRFVEHPSYHYEVFVVRDEYSGFIVYRIEDFNGGRSRVMRILEWMIPQDNLESTALNDGILNHAKNLKCDMIDIFCTHAETLRTIESFGWLMGPCLQNAKIPRLFQPVEYRKDEGVALVLALDSLGKEEIEKVWSRSYFTKSDGDQDRPNVFV